MTTPNIDEPKTISEILEAVYMGGVYEENYGTGALTDGFGPDVGYETLSVSDAKAQIERIMEDVLGREEMAKRTTSASEQSRMTVRNQLRADQRQRLKERL